MGDVGVVIVGVGAIGVGEMLPSVDTVGFGAVRVEQGVLSGCQCRSCCGDVGVGCVGVGSVGEFGVGAMCTVGVGTVRFGAVGVGAMFTVGVGIG